MKTEVPGSGIQRKFDFPPPRQRPFLSDLPARIDNYEDGVARFFHWRTGLDYYATLDQIVDFVVSTKKLKVLDLLADTGTFALKLAGRKSFIGRIYSFDNNITLLERARQRAHHTSLQQAVEFRHFDGSVLPVSDGFGEIAVSIFDFHRHPARQYLAEAFRVLSAEGHLILAEMIEPRSTLNSWSWTFKKIHMKYFQKNPAEALGVYYDREDMIQLIYEAGFRQIIMQGLSAPRSSHAGVFSLIAATK